MSQKPVSKDKNVMARTNFESEAEEEFTRKQCFPSVKGRYYSSKVQTDRSETPGI